MARTLAHIFFGSDKGLIRLRYVGVHGEALRLQFNRLASGLRGLQEGGQLTDAQAVRLIRLSCSTKSRRRTPMSSTSCSSFEDGQLTDGLGKHGRFQERDPHNWTSNIGAAGPSAKRSRALGLSPRPRRHVQRQGGRLVKERGEEKTFNPEFLNRLWTRSSLPVRSPDADLIQIVECWCRA